MANREADDQTWTAHRIEDARCACCDLPRPPRWVWRIDPGGELLDGGDVTDDAAMADQLADLLEERLYEEGTLPERLVVEGASLAGRIRRQLGTLALDTPVVVRAAGALSAAELQQLELDHAARARRSFREQGFSDAQSTLLLAAASGFDETHRATPFAEGQVLALDLDGAVVHHGLRVRLSGLSDEGFRVLEIFDSLATLEETDSQPVPYDDLDDPLDFDDDLDDEIDDEPDDGLDPTIDPDLDSTIDVQNDDAQAPAVDETKWIIHVEILHADHSAHRAFAEQQRLVPGVFGGDRTLLVTRLLVDYTDRPLAPRDLALCTAAIEGLRRLLVDHPTLAADRPTTLVEATYAVAVGDAAEVKVHVIAPCPESGWATPFRDEGEGEGQEDDTDDTDPMDNALAKRQLQLATALERILDKQRQGGVTTAVLTVFEELSARLLARAFVQTLGALDGDQVERTLFDDKKPPSELAALTEGERGQVIDGLTALFESAGREGALPWLVARECQRRLDTVRRRFVEAARPPHSAMGAVGGGTRWTPKPGERPPAPTDPCPCGSGKRYKKCCMAR